MSNREREDMVLSGLKLNALVRAAEAEVTGELVKDQLFEVLQLNELMQFDLRDIEPALAILPVHPEER